MRNMHVVHLQRRLLFGWAITVSTSPSAFHMTSVCGLQHWTWDQTTTYPSSQTSTSHFMGPMACYPSTQQDPCYPLGASTQMISGLHSPLPHTCWENTRYYLSAILLGAHVCRKQIIKWLLLSWVCSLISSQGGLSSLSTSLTLPPIH